MKIKVYFTGGEGINWALDHDLHHLRICTKDFVEEASLDDCQVIHSVWWRTILNIDPLKLKNKIILISIADDPHTLLSDPDFPLVQQWNPIWLCEFEDSMDLMSRSGFRCLEYPSPINEKLFFQRSDKELLRSEFCQRNGINEKSYLIGNFFKDSSMGRLERPKKQKGADLFLEIAKEAKRRGINAHYILAGPRRHWLMGEFDSNQIPFTYIGKRVAEDDIKINTLPHEKVPELLNVLDLYIVPSRWEGAPNAVLECAAAKVPIISTSVGQAKDILSQDVFFDTPATAVDILERDYNTKFLRDYVTAAYSHVEKFNFFSACKRRLNYIYSTAVKLGPGSDFRYQLFHAAPSKTASKLIEKSPYNKSILVIKLCYDKVRLTPDYFPVIESFRNLFESGGFKVLINEDSKADISIVFTTDGESANVYSPLKSKYRLLCPLEKINFKECAKNFDLIVLPSASWIQDVYSELDKVLKVVVRYSGRWFFSNKLKNREKSVERKIGYLKGQLNSQVNGAYKEMLELACSLGWKFVEIELNKGKESFLEVVSDIDLFLSLDNDNPYTNGLSEVQNLGIPVVYNLKSLQEYVYHGGFPVFTALDAKTKINSFSIDERGIKNLVWPMELDETFQLWKSILIRLNAVIVSSLRYKK